MNEPMGAPRERVKELFFAAAELPPADRTTFLASIEDADLRHEVTMLVQAHGASERFLEGGLDTDLLHRTTLTSGQRLGPYEILELIGSGGMGEVYRARDARLGRQVAIKVLPAALGRDEGRRRRFEDEARAASALNHPNVLTVYDVGVVDSDGATFIVMELLEGETLRARLDREPRLTRDETIDLGSEIALGLTAAHATGMVHRDLKPENLFLTRDGHVKILDFGVAKLRRQEGALGETTQHGAVIGTAGYMAPEQVRGEAIDARADLFAWGVVFFEMLTGQRAFAGRSSIDTLTAVLHTDPLQAMPPGTARDADLLAVVRRALAKERADRYQQASNIVADLKAVRRRGHRPALWRRPALAAAVLLVLVAAAFGAWVRQRASGQPQDSRDLVLAVMPFENIAADQSQQYFTAGMTEEIGAQLARVSSLRILSRAAITRYATMTDAAARLRDDLGVGAMLTGSVRMAGPRARISVQLVDTKNGHAIWTQQYDRSMDDILELQSEVAGQIAANMQARLSGDEQQRLAKPPTTSAVAYELYLRTRTAKSREERIALLRQALVQDPAFSVAFAAISRLQGELGDFGDRRYYDESLASARQAVAADASEARAHHALGVIQLRRGRLAEARLAFLRALELAPNLAEAAWDISVTDSSLGHLDESLHWARRGFSRAPNVSTSYYHLAIPLLDLAETTAAQRFLLEAEKRFPTSPRVQYMLAWNEFVAGDDGTSLDRIRRMLRATPDNGEVHAIAAALAFFTGAADAPALVESLFKKSPSARTYMLGASVRAMRGYQLHRSGDVPGGTAMMNEALMLAQQERTEGSELPDVPLEIAEINAFKGARAEALTWLEAAYQSGWRFYRELDRDPFFESLRRDPDYVRIRDRMAADVATMRGRVDLGANPPMPPVPATQPPTK